MNDYPAVSPDLKAIEPVWSWMNRFIQQRHPNSQQHLEELVADAWNAIPRRAIRGYINNIQNVCQRIILNQGWNSSGRYTISQRKNVFVIIQRFHE